MAFELYEGPTFSGRSAALREFAWGGDNVRRGQYLHPLLDVNFSGLAEKVRGEVYLHDLLANLSAMKRDRLCPSDALIADLPRQQALRSLSGGETVRLLLSCALGTRPERLALDCSLEQLDSGSRQRVIDDVLLPISRQIEVHVADNDSADLTKRADRHIAFARTTGPDINSPLRLFAEQLNARAVRAPDVSIERLSFRYRGAAQPVFKDSAFTFRAGRPYLLKAPNGSGKSTLARLLLGVLRPNAGSILVDGRPQRVDRMEKNLFFYAFQNPIIQMVAGTATAYLDLLVASALARPTWLDGPGPMEGAELLRGFGLELFAKQEPFDLPFVALKRLSIAAALASRAPWMFFDEPALSSDAEGRSALAAFFASLCHAGYGVIIVSHGGEFDGLPGACPITIRDGQLWEGQRWA